MPMTATRACNLRNFVGAICCAATIGSLAAVHAAGTDSAVWKTAHSAGVQAAEKADLAAARQCFAKALDEARRTGSAEQAARSAIGYANALTHEGRHEDAARLLEAASRFGTVEGAVSPATVTTIKAGFQIAKAGRGTLDALEVGTLASAGAAPTPDASARSAPTPDASARVAPTPDASARSLANAAPTPDASARKAPTPDASARVAPTPDASARSLAGAAPTPDASARKAPTPDASARVAPTPDASARSLAGAAPTPDASARKAPTPDASARTPMTATAIGAFGVAWWSGRPAASAQPAPTPDASARSGEILDELVGIVKTIGQ